VAYNDYELEKSLIIPDVLIIKPSINWDSRGNIYSSYNRQLYKEFLKLELDFIHDKFAFSHQNVLRGLHGDNKTWKLVSCVHGEIFEVVVDMRTESSTYMRWDAYKLNASDYRQVLIPPGFVNGYYVLSEEAVFHYKLAYEGDYIDAGQQITVAWNDPSLKIDWPCTDPILQTRDKVLEKK
jgi:dTDP-4-dehydrorhamnose 3,5-epimerase